MLDLNLVVWRVGRSVGRTVYALTGEDRDDDVLIGVMDTPELAACVVQAHNDWLNRGAGGQLVRPDARPAVNPQNFAAELDEPTYERA